MTKTNINRMVAVALMVTAMAAGALLALGRGVDAQAAPLTCTTGLASVTVGQADTLTAAGGSGVYTWSGPGLTLTNPTGATFIVNYNMAGTFPVTVTSSDGQTAICNVMVTGATATGGSTPTAPTFPDTGGGAAAYIRH